MLIVLILPLDKEVQNNVIVSETRELFSPRAIVCTSKLKCPLVKSGEELIRHAIEKDWGISETLMYTLIYKGGSQDECSQFYYFEVRENKIIT